MSRLRRRLPLARRLAGSVSASRLPRWLLLTMRDSEPGGRGDAAPAAPFSQLRSLAVSRPASSNDPGKAQGLVSKLDLLQAQDGALFHNTAQRQLPQPFRDLDCMFKLFKG